MRRAVRSVLLGFVSAAFVILAIYLRIATEVIVLLLVIPPLFIGVGVLLMRLLNFLLGLVTSELSVGTIRSTLRLALYYVITVPLFVLLVENSIVFSILSSRPPPWEISVTAMGLAFLPRVINYISSFGTARDALIALLAPLSLMSLSLIALRPQDLFFQTQSLELALLGIVPLIAVGDITLYEASSHNILGKVVSKIEIDMKDLEAEIRSHLETYPFGSLLVTINLEMKRGRKELARGALDSLLTVVNESVQNFDCPVMTSIASAIVDSWSEIPYARDSLKPILQKLVEEHPDTWPRNWDWADNAEARDFRRALANLPERIMGDDPQLAVALLAKYSNDLDDLVKARVIRTCYKNLNESSVIRQIFLDTFFSFVDHAIIGNEPYPYPDFNPPYGDETLSNLSNAALLPLWVFDQKGWKSLFARAYQVNPLRMRFLFRVVLNGGNTFLFAGSSPETEYSSPAFDVKTQLHALLVLRQYAPVQLLEDIREEILRVEEYLLSSGKSLVFDR